MEINQLLMIGAALLAASLVLIVLIFIVRVLRKKPTPVQLIEPELSINVQQLSRQGPDPTHAPLTFYSTPVRLAILVVAPKGLSVQLPNQDQLMVLIERITPGMRQVVEQHEPTFRVWPAQMSVEGFSHAFFHNIQLPGDEGRGSPWCGVVGHITVGMGSLLIGMICVADSPNQIGQVEIKHEGQWRDVLKVGGPN